MVLSHLSKFQKSEWCTQALALALLVTGAGGDVIIDGDTIDIDGVRIRIVQIDTPVESHVRFLISIRRRS